VKLYYDPASTVCRPTGPDARMCMTAVPRVQFAMIAPVYLLSYRSDPPPSYSEEPRPWYVTVIIVPIGPDFGEIEAERARWVEREEEDLEERYAALKRERRAR